MQFSEPSHQGGLGLRTVYKAVLIRVPQRFHTNEPESYVFHLTFSFFRYTPSFMSFFHCILCSRLPSPPPFFFAFFLFFHSCCIFFSPADPPSRWCLWLIAMTTMTPWPTANGDDMTCGTRPPPHPVLWSLFFISFSFFLNTVEVGPRSITCIFQYILVLSVWPCAFVYIQRASMSYTAVFPN